MNDNDQSGGLLDRYTSRLGATEVIQPETDLTDDLGAFGWLRGVRDRAIMLELRHKDGRIEAYAYAWLERAEFDPSEGITLKFGGKEVRITGRNLNSENRPNVRLFNGILRHRVPWVQEADGAAELESLQNATVIELIDGRQPRRSCLRRSM
jgi:hypothetical protein